MGRLAGTLCNAKDSCLPPRIGNRGMTKSPHPESMPRTVDLGTAKSILDFIIYTINWIHSFVKAVSAEPEWCKG